MSGHDPIADPADPAFAPERRPDPRSDPAAALREWDAVVVGAGPAGAFTARQLARAGLSTLLVDRESFPRAKVCGGCLNGRGLAALEAVGLGGVPRSLGAPPLRELLLATRRRRARLPLPGGVSVERRDFDAALLGAAADAGVVVVTGAIADWDAQHGAADRRALRLCVHDTEHRLTLTAGVVVLAGGLGARAPEIATRQRRRDRRRAVWSGLGCVLPEDAWHEEPPLPAGQVVMACGGDAGYAGSVALPGRRRTLAAAVPAEALRRQGPARMVESLLREAGLAPPAGLDDAPWQVSPPLHHRPGAVAAWRLCLVGDAAGYAEPFTGEGLAWALAGALDLSELLVDTAGSWPADTAARWESRHRRRVRRRQRTCRAVGALLGHPTALEATLALLCRVPRLAGPLLRRMNTP